ncbi:MAG: HisA/HisF-related TIM barrel protein [Methanomicrobiaceae archaeon]|nr:HisA/HisF-related TIM barrel protein [Methanomicrobiaceae archaeon]
MDLILAIDLLGGLVVHGAGGNRVEYRPLTWGIASTADPTIFVSELGPRYCYIADLDRIEGGENHDRTIAEIARMVGRCYVDRGVRSPADLLQIEGVIDVVGTETAGEDLSCYPGGYLSVDIRDSRVIPLGESPVPFLGRHADWHFDGIIMLNLGSVGTGHGVGEQWVKEARNAYPGPLIYGGGIATAADLGALRDIGYDGAIVSTAVHRGVIPLEWIREGALC